METGKTGKYFKYAIGEIVLVMIGILLALQVNNWNQNRLIKTERNELVNSIAKEFKNVIPKLEQAIKGREYNIKNVSNAIDLLYNENDKTPIDSIKQKISRVFYGSDYQPQTPTYTMAVSSGKINLIKDDIFSVNISEFMVAKEMLNKMSQISLNTVFVGTLWEIKEEQWEVYRPMEDIPKRFSLTDEEYINYVSQPEVIAKFKNMISLNENIIRRFVRMIEASKNIVQNFESKK
jgi:hypothetical protein